jgi:hypothetical protein
LLAISQDLHVSDSRLRSHFPRSNDPREDAADASSRSQTLLRCCILAFAEPDQDPDNAGRYVYWQARHHATRFARVLGRLEADFVQIFPGFEPTLVEGIAPSGDSGPPSGSSISALKARFREPEMERYNLIGPVAALKGRFTSPRHSFQF